MSEELKRCPFCGGEATLCDYGKEWFYIVCGDCGVVTDHVSAEEIAVRIWNTRPVEDRLKAENEALIRHVKGLTARLKAMEEAYAELFKKNVPERIMVIK